MPVELPELESPEVPPELPRAIVWLGSFVVVMLAGVIVALLTWSTGEPINTLWFWVRLLGFPALTWFALFGLRLHYYGEEMQRLQAEREVRSRDRDTALRFGSEPLAVLGFEYLTALGHEKVAARIAKGESMLSARTSRNGMVAVRHTALTLEGTEDILSRYRACFDALLERISDAVTDIPQEVPFSVRLHLPADGDRQSLLRTWEVCWAAKNLRPTKTKTLSVIQGLMALDQWLDVRGGSDLEKATLYVSAQLHEHASQSSAEAAVCVLVAWAPLAERCALKTKALLHRPVETEAGDLKTGISRALLWGNATSAGIKVLWQAGLTGTLKADLLRVASEVNLGVAQTVGLPGVHDIDLAVGMPGVCAGWLAVALGIESAIQTAAPQLIAWHEATLRFAVVNAARGQEEMAPKA
ncbi:hypothetical protein FSB08_11430 [Paraburkholderia sp. JPY432]|uniref:hypothetical protein n=1 Tax=Paraburkholderia youngii TaxID=2782701 RepID=UPI001594FB1B|nr:hypothetical protein [Paraburkholderia youngii]NVH73174.1 hypothetical protein [Paraburkholderia youngii]